MAYHARAAPDRAFLHRSGRRVVERGEDMSRLHMKAVDVVERSVPRLGDNRKSPRLKARTIHLPFEDGIANDANAVRVGDGDGSFEDAGLLKPRGPGHLAVAVE